MTPSSSSGGFELSRHGVWPSLQTFIGQIPEGSELFWVTFTVSPTEECLKLLRERRLDVTVLCRHPRSDMGGDESEGRHDNTVRCLGVTATFFHHRA